MTYKVLARKWRPQQFSDMIGQDAVRQALINALDGNRLHHAYLFTGTRGVGKTTIARILAKCLNCETNGVSSTPCGQCSVCRGVETGSFLDLVEVDAASRTKVEETRELLENVPYLPNQGRFKVYLIDEVHMFSTHSFNALLKTLEEPPEHVKFLLATTDPQKVPVTVLSRCLQFNLQRLAPSRLAAYLAGILEAESLSAEQGALDLLARAAEGSVRDALSLTEQAIALGDGTLREADVQAMLGRVSTDNLLTLIDLLAARQAPALFEAVESLADFSPDYTQILGELSSLLHRVAVTQLVPDSLDDDQPSHQRLSELAARLAGDEIQLYYQIALQSLREMPFAPDPREAFDMTLLRMLAYAPAAPTKTSTPPSGASRQSSPSPGSASGQTPEPATGSAAPDPAATGSTASTPAPTSSVPTPPAAAVDRRQDLQRERWSVVVSELGLAGMPLQLAENTVLALFRDSTVQLELERSMEHLNTARFVERLTSAVSNWLGEPLRIDIALVDGPLDTPAAQEAGRRAAALDAARASIEQDPIVRRLVDEVDGVVEADSVRPLGQSPVDSNSS